MLPAKFVKLMMMTTSDNDREALSAVRMANAMLRQARINWEELLAAIERLPAAEKPTRMRADDNAEEIEEMLEVLLGAKLTEAQWKFASGLQRFWQERGYLTPKQMSALRETAERIRT